MTNSANNELVMKQAKEALYNKWGISIGATLVFSLIMGVVQNIPHVGGIAALFIGGAFQLGITYFSLSIARNEEAYIGQVFDGFKYYTKTLATYLLMILYILLWMLLLIAPGIIKAISYSMTFFVLADNPELSAKEALIRSEEIMDGNKMEYFIMGLKIFGLALLCILTLGVGFLWLAPYSYVCHAKFYEMIKTSNETSFEHLQ